MAVVELTRKEDVAAVVARDPVLHAYELGDLDDFFWPHTRWWGLEREGRLGEVVLLYSEPDPPVLLAMTRAPADGMADLLAEVLHLLPERVYAHVHRGLVPLLEERYAADPHGLHLRMGLARTDLLEPLDTADPAVLGPDDLAEVEALYRDAYPGTWFVPRMLESGRYVGIREQGRLVAIAGVHVHAPGYGVGVLGNVATAPDARGRGLATAACARLCRLLLQDGIDTVALNVHAENEPAIRSYRRLGFEAADRFLELMLTAREPTPGR